jgi:hypothetical protein
MDLATPLAGGRTAERVGPDAEPADEAALPDVERAAA